MLGQEPSFGPIFSCSCILWIGFLFCSWSSYFSGSVCLVCFMGSGLFLFNSLCHIGIAFSSLLSLHAASSTSCLGPLFLRAGSRPAFLWGPSRGVVWGWPRGRGQYLFRFFSFSRGVWVKTGAALEDGGSYDALVASTSASSVSKKTTVFNCATGNTTKMEIRGKQYANDK